MIGSKDKRVPKPGTMAAARAALAALALAAPALALAQSTPSLPTRPASPVPPPADPARVAAAAPVVDQLWPIGTYRRMMEGPMSKMMESMLAPMMDTPAAAVGNAADPSGKLGKSAGNQTMAQMAEARDPAFRERMRITVDVMTREMIPLMERIEPRLRLALTQSYARNFTVGQLGDMRAFFSTPSGQVYARNAMMIFVDPQITRSMQSFLPEMLSAMPGIMKKVEAATAHLPKPRAAKP